jgi:hypothetical protein
MNELLLIALTITTAVAAKSLWKVDQAYSISALLMGGISLIWYFSHLSGLGQVVIAGMLLGAYHLYSSKAISMMH